MNKTFAALCACVAAGSANAGVTFFQMDINAALASAGGTFTGTNHTGSVTASQDANTVLAGIFVFETPVAFTGNVATMNGRVDLNNGQVLGAFFDVLLTDGSEFHCSVSPNTGSVVNQAGQGFQIDGLTFNAHFSNLVGGTHFAGVDMSAFANGTFDGAFLMHGYSPNAGGSDADTQFEFYAFVPTPGAMALFGVAGLAGLRRRR